MARFCDVVGYAEMQETAPGVWSEVFTERTYYGDVIRNARRLEDGSHLNNDVTVNNSISILADAYAEQNIHALRYVGWMGAKWKVTNVEVQRPRLVLTIGEVYNVPSN